MSVLSGRGETIAAKLFRRELPDAALEYVAEEVRRRSLAAGRGSEASEFLPDHPELAGRIMVVDMLPEAFDFLVHLRRVSPVRWLP